jgi:penicillin-binding protein 2
MQRDELESLRSRLSVVAYVIVAAMLILVAGFWHFQMAQTSYYVELADNNALKQIPLIAPRGQILDREGRPFVDNRASFNVVYVREGSKHTVAETIAAFADGLGMTAEELLGIIKRKEKEAKYRPILLKEDIQSADIAFVKARMMDYPEIRVEDRPRRRYEGELAAHAIGYVSEITESDLKKSKFKGYKPGDEVGKFGLEQTYDSILRGTDGYKRVVVDNWGRQKELIDQKLPTKGDDIRTTLDLDLQRAAEEAFGDKVGTAIALDPLTGEVLVMVSKPSFDPNLFATTLSGAAYQSLIKDPRKPFINRAIQSMYPPGSVFKVFMTAAAMESETLDPLDHIHCSGSTSMYGVTKKCWKAGGHGNITLYEALKNSCNVFFYNVGRKLDIDHISDFAHTMGLGRHTGIDLSDEVRGLVGNRAWKQTHYKTKDMQVWRDIETIDVSIGQGAVMLTPIQAAWAMGGLTSGGRLMQPHLVNPEYLNAKGYKGRPVKDESYPVGARTVDEITKALWGVVNDGGTGTRAAVKGFDVAGKTGTAQVVGLDKYKSGGDSEDHAWFVGFAPYRNPEIVVAVFVEHGGHGGSASAPIAHAIFDTYYKKKTGQFNPPGSGQIAQFSKQKP